jgi:hypothetical protein
VNEIPANKPYLLSRWGEHASEGELELAAKGMIAATDSKQQKAHLRIFARRRFPLDVQALIALVDIEQDRVGIFALKALTQISHPAVRALAFRLMDTKSVWRGGVIDLLAHNYEYGDNKIVLRWFEEEKDRDALHALGMDLTDFWKQHPDQETETLMLQSLYERGPCSFCRGRAVKGLMDQGVLTDELRAECSWDANYDIRNLVSAPATPAA